jgi:hypothetical protein
MLPSGPLCEIVNMCKYTADAGVENIPSTILAKRETKLEQFSDLLTNSCLDFDSKINNAEALTEVGVSKDKPLKVLFHTHTSSVSHKSVTFNLQLNEEYPVTPYSEVYSIHPRFFDFDSEGAMTPTRNFYEMQKEMARLNNSSTVPDVVCSPPQLSSPYSAGLRVAVPDVCATPQDVRHQQETSITPSIEVREKQTFYPPLFVAGCQEVANPYSSGLPRDVGHTHVTDLVTEGERCPSAGLVHRQDACPMGLSWDP